MTTDHHTEQTPNPCLPLPSLSPLPPSLPSPPPTPSPPPKNRSPLLLKRPQRLPPILRPHHPLISHILDLLPPPPPPHRLDRLPNRHRPPLTNPPRDLHRLEQNPLPRPPLLHPFPFIHINQPIAQADKIRLRGPHAPARQDQVQGAGRADQRGEAVSAACAGEDREAGFGEGDEGRGGEEAEVGGEG